MSVKTGKSPAQAECSCPMGSRAFVRDLKPDPSCPVHSPTTKKEEADAGSSEYERSQLPHVDGGRSAGKDGERKAGQTAPSPSDLQAQLTQAVKLLREAHELCRLLRTTDNSPNTVAMIRTVERDCKLLDRIDTFLKDNG